RIGARWRGGVAAARAEKRQRQPKRYGRAMMRRKHAEASRDRLSLSWAAAARRAIGDCTPWWSRVAPDRLVRAGAPRCPRWKPHALRQRDRPRARGRGRCPIAQTRDSRQPTRATMHTTRELHSSAASAAEAPAGLHRRRLLLAGTAAAASMLSPVVLAQ